MSDFLFEQQRHFSYRPGLIIAVLAVGAFVTWASIFTIDQSVRGYGRIIPSGEKQVIQHLEGGIITDIAVQEGERVEKGQLLFKVQNQNASSERAEIGVRIAEAQLRLKRLRAEYAGDTTLDYSEEESNTNPEIVTNQLLQFQTRRQQLQEKMNVLREQKRQKDLTLDDLNAQLRNLRAERQTADEQFAINKKLRDAGAISESKFLDAQSRVQNFNTRIAQVEKQIPVIRAEQAEAQNRLRQELETHKSDISEELGQANLEIQQLNERIKSSEDRVQRHLVMAPADGIINKIYVNTIGGVLKAGDPLADLIPLNEALVVEADISTNDRGQVWPGLPVNVRITAYDYTTYGSIKGTLTSISADSFSSEQGEKYYQVKVALEGEQIAEDKPLYPGMTTEINILTGKRKVMDYLLKPVRQTTMNALREK